MSKSNLRFAVLWHHEVAEPHFDLMFETAPGSQLATWRSSAWPIIESTALQRLKDHRRIFLTFEGELSSDRGKVQRVADGACEILSVSAQKFVVRLNDEEQSFQLTLEQIDQEIWQAIPE